MGKSVANELYVLSQNNTYTHFSDLLFDLKEQTSLDARQLELLIKIDFFDMFGNQRELIAIRDTFDMFKCGTAKQIKKERIDGTEYEEIVKKYATGKTKSGAEAKSYTLLNTKAIINECEERILSLGVNDLSILIKARNFKDIMGYPGYYSGEEKDRNKLYISNVFPLKRRKDGLVFGYNLVTHSLGSGKESRMTVFKAKYERDPIKQNDIIVCKKWDRDGAYFRLLEYEHLII